MHLGRRIGSLALVGALALGACSSGGDGADLAAEDPKAAMAAAAKRTAEAKTVKLSMAATLGNGFTVASGTGAYDFENQLGRFSLKTTIGGNADMVITEDTLYLKAPQPGPDGKPWVALTDAALSSGQGGYLSQLRGQIDPRSTLKVIGANVPDLRKVGTQTIRGTKTTHLAGRVDLSDAAIAKAPVSARADLKKSQEAFGADGYPIDVWFDRDGRVRRIQYEIDTETGAQKVTSKIRLDLFDFGHDAKIAVPKASEVRDGNELLGATTTTTP